MGGPELIRGVLRGVGLLLERDLKHEWDLVSDKFSTASFEDGGGHVVRNIGSQQELRIALLRISREMECSGLQSPKTQFCHTHLAWKRIPSSKRECSVA